MKSYSCQSCSNRKNHNHDNINSYTTNSSFYCATASLCFCFLTHSYLLISLFSYVGYFVLHLDPNLTSNTVGLYAGVLSSSFMMGRMVTSVLWGRMADTYGRKAVIQLSLFCSSIVCLGFGFSSSFSMAFTIRFLLGTCNAMVPTGKTAISELASMTSNPESFQQRGMALLLGMWGWGFLISPSISGFLSDPVKQYPNSVFIQKYTIFLTDYPFVLPNILGTLLCLLATLSSTLFVQETLETKRDLSYLPGDVWNCLKDTIEKKNKYGTEDETKVLVNHSKEELSLPTDSNWHSIWEKSNTRQHMILYWLWAFVTMGSDEITPLFLLAHKGLKLTEISIGRVLSGAGIVYAVFQYSICLFFIEKFGIYGSLRLSSWSCAPFILFIPISKCIEIWGSPLFITSSEHIKLQTYLFLWITLGLERIFQMMYFSSISVGMNLTVSSNQRATMNGYGIMIGSVAKAFGPIMFGYLSSVLFGYLENGLLASFILFGLIATCMAITAYWTTNLEY